VAALEARAKIETGNLPVVPDNMVAFQTWLQEQVPIQVVVPFARGLTHGMTKSICSTRILRDYARTISLIKTVAIIRQHNREKDTIGKVIAQLEDYEQSGNS